MSSRHLAAIGQARSAVDWWLSELAGCIPGAGKGGGPSMSRVLRIEQGRLRLQARGRNKDEMPFPLDDAARARLARAVGRRRVAVVIAAERLLVCPVDLPLAAERNPLVALRFEVDRRTPFRSGDVHLGWRRRSRDVSARRLTGEMVCIARRNVEPVLDVLAAEGSQFGGLWADLDGEMVALSLGGSEAGKPVAGRPGLLRVAFAASLLALVAGPGLALHRLETVAAETSARADALKAQAARATDIQARIAALENRSRAIAAMGGGTSVLGLLAEVGAIAPDDTYLTSFRFDGSNVLLDGRSASASALAAILDASPLLRSPSFRTAVVPSDEEDEGEQFSLSFGIEDRSPEGKR